MAHVRLFEKASHIEDYVKYRPSYPPGVFQRILSFLGEKKPGPYELQVDVACGSGQATFGLASHFKRVIGFDVSQNQIEAASKANTAAHVEFMLSPGESLPVPGGAADLVTCATAVHWLDFTEFCKESDRILKPSGCLALFGYGTPWLDHAQPDIKKQLAKDFNELYEGSLGPYWNERTRHIESKYQDLPLPFEDKARDDSFEIRVQWSVSHLIGYIRSWSSYQIFLEKNPSQKDLLPLYENKVMSTIAECSAEASSTMIEVVMPVFMLLGRKPAGSSSQQNP